VNKPRDQLKLINTADCTVNQEYYQTPFIQCK